MDIICIIKKIHSTSDQEEAHSLRCICFPNLLSGKYFETNLKNKMRYNIWCLNLNKDDYNFNNTLLVFVQHFNYCSSNLPLHSQINYFKLHYNYKNKTNSEVSLRSTVLNLLLKYLKKNQYFQPNTQSFRFLIQIHL